MKENKIHQYNILVTTTDEYLKSDRPPYSLALFSALSLNKKLQ